MSASLTSLPIELILQILTEAAITDFASVFCLISTCTRLYKCFQGKREYFLSLLETALGPSFAAAKALYRLEGLHEFRATYHEARDILRTTLYSEDASPRGKKRTFTIEELRGMIEVHGMVTEIIKNVQGMGPRILGKDWLGNSTPQSIDYLEVYWWLLRTRRWTGGRPPYLAEMETWLLKHYSTDGEPTIVFRKPLLIRGNILDTLSHKIEILNGFGAAVGKCLTGCRCKAGVLCIDPKNRNIVKDYIEKTCAHEILVNMNLNEALCFTEMLAEEDDNFVMMEFITEHSAMIKRKQRKYLGFLN